MDEQASLADEVASVEGTATDPVCGMQVVRATARHVHQREGTAYYFCCGGCRAKFEADPAKYLSPLPVAEAAQPGAIYTCPMDPEVRQVGPGACPVCGMALEPAEVTAEAGPNPELADMTPRLVAGAVLAMPVVVLGMGGLVPARLAGWLELVLATPVVVWAGWPFLQRGWASVGRGRLNMFTLIALGTVVAFGYSAVAVAVPGVFPAGFRDGGAVPVYFEAAVAITVLALLGQVLELRARGQTGDAIRALLRLAPKVARRVRAGEAGDEEVAVGAIGVGDLLRVRPGEAVPVDGVVLEGASAVDEALVTGEAMPVAKGPGSAVTGGTVNGAGALVMRAERVGAQTVLARIVALVAEAQRSRAPVQRVADAVAAWFVPAVLGVAVLAFAGWAVWGPAPALGYGLVAAVSVVIIACPCALGLATPMSIGVGIGRGAGMGVLVRSAAALERLERVDTLLVDKTGTLTAGRPVVTEVVAAPGWSESEVLALAAAVEQGSEHPLAAAVLAATPARRAVSAVVSTPGLGVRGMVEGRAVLVGNAAMLAGVDVGGLAGAAAHARQGGATAVYVAVDGRAAGVIAVADPVKPGARAALDSLRAAGLRVVMVTGDDAATAAAVAAGLGIADVHAGVLPGGKRDVVVALQKAGRVVAMAGDGVNDAPALAAADVGIAMGTGTDVAIGSAGITLMRGELAGLVRARALSRATMRNVRQNLVFAFAYNLIGVPVAAGVLYPAFGWVLNPGMAALAMSLSSVSVIANALRLRSVALPLGRV